MYFWRSFQNLQIDIIVMVASVVTIIIVVIIAPTSSLEE
jgi:hypothetical protein